jgi:alanine racemase
VRAVIKSNGYGWGFEPLVRALDAVVDGYYVSDADEFDRVRPLTERPLATLANVPAARVGALLGRGGIPTLSTPEALDAADAWTRAAGKRARIRVALRTAVGWSGIEPGDVAVVARALATRALDVELSSHITDASLAGEQTRAFHAARAAFESANVAVVATDLASSEPAAHGLAAGCSHVRVGVGLFGARFGTGARVESAIAVRAPVVETCVARGQRVGYGVARAPNDGYLATVRCGYGDGFPRVASGELRILAIGMQFTTVHRDEPSGGAMLPLIERDTNLDRLAASAGIAVHQLVAGLGLGRAALARSTVER